MKVMSRFARLMAQSERGFESMFMRAALAASLRGDLDRCFGFVRGASRAKENAAEVGAMSAVWRALLRPLIWFAKRMAHMERRTAASFHDEATDALLRGSYAAYAHLCNWAADANQRAAVWDKRAERWAR